MMKTDYTIAWLTLLSGLCISGVAIYYSVAGLIAIFPMATVAIAIMGCFLEVSKLVATVWLKRYWNKAPIAIRIYLCLAVVILMAITSMGIYGFLSKSHSDQSISGDEVSSKVQFYDEQIASLQSTVNSSKSALKQMDAIIEQTLSRTENAQGAASAAYLRRLQQKERNALTEDIAVAQKKIGELMNERAPYATQKRNVEAEVGPLKYIAAAVYGDENLDNVALEKAVRLVSMLIVIVFDPLAVVLLLSSQYTFQHIREQNSKKDELVKRIEIEKLETQLEQEEVREHKAQLEELKIEKEILETKKEIEEFKHDAVDSDVGGLSQMFFSVDILTRDRKKIAEWRKYSALQIWMERLFEKRVGKGVSIDCEFCELTHDDLGKLENDLNSSVFDTILKEIVIGSDSRFDASMKQYTLDKIGEAKKEIEHGRKIFYYSRK